MIFICTDVMADQNGRSRAAHISIRIEPTSAPNAGYRTCCERGPVTVRRETPGPAAGVQLTGGPMRVGRSRHGERHRVTMNTTEQSGAGLCAVISGGHEGSDCAAARTYPVRSPDLVPSYFGVSSPWMWREARGCAGLPPGIARLGQGATCSWELPMPGGMNGGKVMNEPSVPVSCPKAARTVTGAGGGPRPVGARPRR